MIPKDKAYDIIHKIQSALGIEPTIVDDCAVVNHTHFATFLGEEYGIYIEVSSLESATCGLDQQCPDCGLVYSEDERSFGEDCPDCEVKFEFKSDIARDYWIYQQKCPTCKVMFVAGQEKCEKCNTNLKYGGNNE